MNRYPPNLSFSTLSGAGRTRQTAYRRRACPTMSTTSQGGFNTTGEGNYVILEARGRGHYVGCHLDIENLRETKEFDWYGEGDDMIFIDGDAWPPTLHGTGMEDYFNCAFGPGRGDEHLLALARDCLGRGGEFLREVQLVPVSCARPGNVQRIDPRDDRARACEPSKRRLLQHCVLVPDRAAHVVRHIACRAAFATSGYR